MAPSTFGCMGRRSVFWPALPLAAVLVVVSACTGSPFVVPNTGPAFDDLFSVASSLVSEDRFQVDA